MTEKPQEPPRGHAAWTAAKERIAKSNEAAWARGRKERAAENARVASRRRDAERADAASRPAQPHGRQP